MFKITANYLTVAAPRGEELDEVIALGRVLDKVFIRQFDGALSLLAAYLGLLLL